MIGFLNGGPYHGHAFGYPPDVAVRLHDPGAGGLLAVMSYIDVVDSKPGAPLLRPTVRAGTRFPAGAGEPRAIYRDDPDMTRMHGWLMLGVKLTKVAVFTFDRDWTAAVRRPE